MSSKTPYSTSKSARNGRTFAGLALLVVGGMLLLQRLDFFFFPTWLFRWPMWLIIAGLYTGAKHDFRNQTWLFLVGLGIIFLLQPYVYIPVWPLILIMLGLWLIFRRNHTRQRPGVTWDARMDAPQADVFNDGNTAAEPLADEYTKDAHYTSYSSSAHTGDDFFDCTSIFSGTKRVILSKNFKGGDIVNILGGTEIDLTQADFTGRAVIDITQLLGGIKLIVPPHWQIVPEISAVFSSVDDKRKTLGAVQQSADKILVLKGSSILAGIELRSY